jgi:ribosomal protein L29
MSIRNLRRELARLKTELNKKRSEQTTTQAS